MKKSTPEGIAFNEANAAYEAHNARKPELELEVGIAKRIGDTDAVAAAEQELKDHATQWHPLFVARKEAALILCDAVGVDPTKLKYSLPN